MEIEDYLREASKPGEARFTIDPKRALEKMAAYQLPDPADYVLKLVQWSIKSGATAVKINAAKGQLSVSHNGRPLPRDLAVADFDFDLAAGLAGALRKNPSFLGLACVDEEGLFSLQIHPSHPQVNFTAPSQARQSSVMVQGLNWDSNVVVGNALALFLLTGFVSIFGAAVGGSFGFPHVGAALAAGLVLRYTPSGEWDFLRDSRALMYTEGVRAKKGCSYAPIPVYLNGRPINAPCFGLHSRYQESAGGLDVDCSVNLSRYPTVLLEEPGCALAGPFQHGDPLPNLFSRGRPMRTGRAMAIRDSQGKNGYSYSYIDWVRDGVVVESGRIDDLQLLGWRVIACAHDLDVDLSQFQLVRTARYQQVRQMIVGRIRSAGVS